jgi:hypothetical protein
MDLNFTAKDLFDELKSRFSNLTLGDESAQTTVSPEEARFFKFSWNNNPISISIDEENLRLIYNKNLTGTVESEQEQQWYDFARFMREFAVSHNLGFKPQDVEKIDLEQDDFEFLSSVNTVQESKMHGTPKTSYDKLDKTKMIIRHSKHVDETIPGSRSRNIDCIFIENAQGERFRFPYNYLKGARAMMMHVAKGGNAYDEIGESIVKKVEEIRDLRNFNAYTVRSGLLDETTQPFVEAAKDKIKEAKKTLERLAKSNTYESALENLNQNQSELSEDEVAKLRQKFTKETFDDSIVDAFKHLPMDAIKEEDDEEEVDVMTLPSTADRYKNYVDTWLQKPDSKLVLKKDDSYDKFQNNLRGQMKDTEQKLSAIMRDIATRFLSPDSEDDAIVNFASDMDQELSKSGELFAKPNPQIKQLKSTAIKLANKYLQDMKKMQADDEYADEVRKSPEDIKAFKNIKGQDIDKGKLSKQYKRKYKDESEQFEAWADAQLEGLGIKIDEDEIDASEYQDAFKKKTDQSDIVEAPKKFAEGIYTHQVKALTVMPTQDKTLWAEAGELPKKFNVTQMNIGIYDEEDDQDPYSYGNTGLEVFHDAGTWQMYTDDQTEQQISDYLGVKVSFSEQGMQNEKFMHFDISDEAVAQLIDKGAFKMTKAVGEGRLKDERENMEADASDMSKEEFVKAHGEKHIHIWDKVQKELKYGTDETATEDDMSTGTVAVGKKGKTRRATGIDDNPYDHNEGEDQTALVNAALWNMKDVYQTIMSGEALSEDDMFSYGDLVQYLEQADMPDHYSKFWDLITDAINSAGGFGGQGSELQVDKNIAPQIKTLYQQFKAATAKIKGVKEVDEGSLDQFRNLYKKSIGSDDAAVTLRELIQAINDDSLWSDQFPQLKQFTGVSPQSGSKVVTAKKIPGNSADEKIEALVKEIDDDEWVNATAKHLMRSFTLGENSDTEAKDPYSEDINDILRLSGLK